MIHAKIDTVVLKINMHTFFLDTNVEMFKVGTHEMLKMNINMTDF